MQEVKPRGFAAGRLKGTVNCGSSCDRGGGQYWTRTSDLLRVKQAL